jgi:tripartite-type tricarboxylate transporter receptor subunit TctC
MTHPRRAFLRLAAAAVALPAIARSARAQTYPARPVRIIVGFSAGGPTDINARIMAQWLSERLGQQFLVENRPGAAGNIATEAALRSAPDGYTLLQVTSSNAVNATFYDNLSFNILTDTAPVGAIIRLPFVMEVTPSVPAKTVPEFIAYAKANPGKINMASGGIGTSIHIAGELFKMMAGVNLIHVPYRGSAPALTDMISGQVQVMFDIMTSSIGHIRSGALRALAVTTATRSESLPELPTVGDFLPGYEASAWYGIAAPKRTPSEIIEKLNNDINAGLADPGIKARLTELGGTVIPGSPADFGRLLARRSREMGEGRQGLRRQAGVMPSRFAFRRGAPARAQSRGRERRGRSPAGPAALPVLQFAADCAGRARGCRYSRHGVA